MDSRRGHMHTPRDLLNLAVTAQNPDGREESTGTGAMDPERRVWLQEAMTSTFQSVDLVREMKAALRILTDKEIVEEQKQAALDGILVVTENIDFANDFCKIGGLPVIQKYLAHSESEFRALSCEVLAQLTQNNPYGQKAVSEAELLKTLLEMLEKDGNVSVRIKALSALSSFLRSNEDGQATFSKLDGFSVLLRAMMETKDQRFQTKAAFLLSRVCSDNDTFRRQLGDMGVTQHLISLLRGTDHGQHHEHLMEALATLLKGNPNLLQEAPEQMDIVSFLRSRRKEIENVEEFQDEVAYVDEILGILNTEKSISDDVER